MQHLDNTTQKVDSPPLVSLEDFIRYHKPPINMRWAIQIHAVEMTRLGVVTRYGRKILIDPKQFWEWLRGNKVNLNNQ